MSGFFWLASYPKSGNTWLRALLKNYMLDDETPVSINNLHTGFSTGDRAWLDACSGLDTLDLTDNELDRLRAKVYCWYASTCGDTDFHKTHEALETFGCVHSALDNPDLSGAVYIVRNPIAVAESLADFLDVSVDAAVDIMAKGSAAIRPAGAYYGPVRQRLSSWSRHVESWREARNIRVLFVRYEDLVENPMETFSEIVRFTGLEHSTERVEKAVSFSRFDELQGQEENAGFVEMHSRRRFFRRGSGREKGPDMNPQIADRIVSTHGAVMRTLGYL